MQPKIISARFRALALLFICTFCLSACKEKVTEPEFSGHYFIENNTGLEIKVQAKDGSKFLVLKNSQIAPYSKEKIFEAESEVGRSVSPSLFFTEFRIFINRGLKDSTLYTGVRDNDWEEGAMTEEYQEFILSIP